MKVFIEKDKKNISLNYSGSVAGLLEKLDINTETVIVVRENELLDEGDSVNDDDRLKLMSVISGG